MICIRFWLYPTCYSTSANISTRIMYHVRFVLNYYTALYFSVFLTCDLYLDTLSDNDVWSQAFAFTPDVNKSSLLWFCPRCEWIQAGRAVNKHGVFNVKGRVSETCKVSRDKQQQSRTSMGYFSVSLLTQEMLHTVFPLIVTIKSQVSNNVVDRTNTGREINRGG